MLSKKSVLGAVLGVLGLLILTVSVQAQTFEKTYDFGSDDFGFCAIKTNSGGYLIGGRAYIDTLTLTDILLLKTDAQGETTWARTYRVYEKQGCSEWVLAIREVNDGYIMVGLVDCPDQTSEGFIMKISQNGERIWFRSFPNTQSLAHLTCDSTSCVAVGLSPGSGGSFYGYLYVMKFTQDLGDSIWAYEWGRGEEIWGSMGRSIKPVKNGFIITGKIQKQQEAGDIYLLAISDSGDSLWSRIYGGSGFDCGEDVCLTDDGYLIAATTYSEPNTDGAILALKTDSLGNLLWSRTYGGEKSEGVRGVIQDRKGDYIFVGTTSSFGGPYQRLYLVKTDPQGDTIWTKTFSNGSPANRSYGYFILEPQDSCYVAGGVVDHVGVNFDVYLLKIYPNGTFTDVSEPQEPNLPQKFALYQNYPNPFNPSTTISFDLPENSRVKLEIYNILGQKVRILVDGEGTAGYKKVVWDGENNWGKKVVSGIYFYRLQIGSFVKTAKMTLLK